MAKIGIPKGSGKRLKVREKSVKSQGILKWILSGNPEGDQTGAVCSGSKLFASILNWSVMLGNYLQQTTSAHNIFRCIFFLAL